MDNFLKLSYAKQVKSLYSLRKYTGNSHSRRINGPWNANLKREIDQHLKAGGFKSINEALKYERENRKEATA